MPTLPMICGWTICKSTVLFHHHKEELYSPPMFDNYALPPPRYLLMILEVDGKRFPVYWIHYVCWQAMARRTIEKFGRDLPRRFEDADAVTNISLDEFWWAELSVWLIQAVQRNRDTTGEREKEFIQQAKDIALEIPLPFIHYVLGDCKSYMKRLSQELRAQGPFTIPALLPLKFWNLRGDYVSDEMMVLGVTSVVMFLGAVLIIYISSVFDQGHF